METEIHRPDNLSEKSNREYHYGLIDRARRPEFHIETTTTSEGFDRLAEPWNELCRKSRSSIFQTFDWNRAWWNHFGNGYGLRLIHMKNDDQIVAILPMFLDSIRWADRSWYQTLRLIGSNRFEENKPRLLGLESYTDYLDLLVRPGYEQPVIGTLAQMLLQAAGEVDEILLESLPPFSPLFQLADRLQPEGWKAGRQTVASHQTIQLPENWESFLYSLSKNSRSHARRALKRVEHPEHQYFKVTRASTADEVNQQFDRLVSLHQKRWNEIGSLGTFAETRHLAFHREVTSRFFRNGWLDLKSLSTLDEEDPLAIELNYRYDGMLYGVHCAVDSESKHYCNGPGTSLLCHTLKNTIDEGVHTYDFLRGGESYKMVLSNLEVNTQTLTLISPKRSFQGAKRSLIRWMMIRRRLYREWKQNRMILQSRPILPAVADLSRHMTGRLKQKYNRLHSR